MLFRIFFCCALFSRVYTVHLVCLHAHILNWRTLKHSRKEMQKMPLWSSELSIPPPKCFSIWDYNRLAVLLLDVLWLQVMMLQSRIGKKNEQQNIMQPIFASQTCNLKKNASCKILNIDKKHFQPWFPAQFGHRKSVNKCATLSTQQERQYKWRFDFKTDLDNCVKGDKTDLM